MINTGFLKYITGIILLIGGVFSANALTPDEVLTKAKAQLSGAKSLSADFSMTINGESLKGKILSKGKKFYLSSPLSVSWFNGTDLWTYVPGNAETTVMKPSGSELSEANPLLYINTAGNYSVKGTKQKTKGAETIVLVPKKSGSNLKSVTLTIDSKSWLPRKIVVAPSSGNAITISLSNIKLNAGVKDSDFEYPRSKYPNAKVNDLR